MIFAYYGLAPSSLQDTSVSLTAAILGVVGLVYFATVHQVLSRTRQALSTLIFTVITFCNVILIIASTGGLNSPFYSLWLLAIVVAGIFGTTETLGVLSLTLVYYLFELVREGMHGPYIKDHLVELGITLVAGALAEWVHSRSRKAVAATTRLESLSGQLTAEQLKAEAIVQGIGEGVMVVDGGRKIQLFNRAAQQLTGWDEDSAMGIDYNLVLQLKTTADQPLADGHDPFIEAWKMGDTHIRDDVAHDHAIRS